VGSAVGPKGGSGAYSHIGALLGSPAGRQTLQSNFDALMDAVPAIDGFDFDDEDNYSVDTITQLALMLTANGTNGKIITFCPYWDESFWSGCLTQIHSELSSMSGPSGPASLQPVAWWNVQCYPPGGEGNVQSLPAWVRAVEAPGTGITAGAAPAFIVPGLGAPATPPGPSSPAGVQDQFATWSHDVPGVDGGFIFTNAGMQPGATLPPYSTYTMQQYASAISDGLQGMTAPAA